MPASSPRRIILVGCGSIARQLYVPALRVLQDAGLVRVSAIVDPSVNAREIVARSFPRAGQTAALEQTTAPADSLAIIASPSRIHAIQALAAFERGWHVLCENPMASSPTEAAEMVAAAQRHRRILAVNLYKRFFPAARYLRDLCRDGLLGPLVSFSIEEGGPARSPAGPALFDRTQTPGGVLYDLGVHVFDLLGWWLGDPAGLRYADDAMGGLEANAFVHLEYAKGVTGGIHLSRDWPTAQQQRFVFERGIVTWRVNEAAGLTLQLTGAPSAISGTLVAPRSAISRQVEPCELETNAQCFILQLRNILGALAGTETLLTDGEDGLHALRLIERCYARRSLVEQPWLTAEESARAQEFSTSLPAAT